MQKSRLKKLFSGMCCSVCRHDFDENSITVLREEESLLVLKITCPECGKSFGTAFLGAGIDIAKDDCPLEFKNMPEPVSYDDVLDAHYFIDNLQKDWMKYIPGSLKEK